MQDRSSPRASILPASRTFSPAVREIPPHCATCTNFHEREPGDGYGECRLHPPTLSGNPEAGTLRKRHPLHPATDFCSAHPDAASLTG